MGKRGKTSHANDLPKDHTLESLGSEAWNVADGFMKLKVLRQLIQFDRLENIALYGSEDMDDATDLPYDSTGLSIRRFEALRRLVSIIKQLISNTRFAIKSAHTDRINGLLLRVKNVEECMEYILIIEQNLVSHEDSARINEDLFKECVEIIQDIKTELNYPLNKAGLIFKQSDDVDFEQLMNDIIEGG